MQAEDGAPVETGGMGMDAGVSELLAAAPHPHPDAIHALRTALLAVDPTVRESVKWNSPSYSTADHFATFHLRGGKLQVVMHLGAKGRPNAGLRTKIADPDGLLQWRGPDRAIVTFADLADVEEKKAAFVAIVRGWLTHVRRV